jgi:hypothetical protein
MDENSEDSHVQGAGRGDAGLDEDSFYAASGPK